MQYFDNQSLKLSLEKMVLNEAIIEFLKEKGVKKLYHFTDKSNILSIVRNGGLWSWYECEKRGIDIPAPGGSDLSRFLDRHYHIENYVRLSFVKRHPMMYAAVNDGRIDNPVVLEIDLDILTTKKFRFSDSNATSNNVGFGATLEFIEDNIRFDTFSQRYNDLDDDEKSYFQAEVLIEGFIPIKYISNISEFGDIKSPDFDKACLGVADSYLNSNDNEKLNHYSELQKSIDEFAELTKDIDFDALVPIGELVKEREKQNHCDYRPRGVIQMMALFGILYGCWIVFLAYCMFKWQNVPWYDYIWGGLIGLLGGLVVVLQIWGVIYWILVKLDIVDSL